jgi:hypothetical protein
MGRGEQWRMGRRWTRIRFKFGIVFRRRRRRS